MPARQRQDVKVNVVTKGPDAPSGTVWEILNDHPAVVEVEVVDVGPVREVPGPNRERLIKLAQWVGAEHAKQELGLPSEWNQDYWLTRDRKLSCGTACCIAGKVAFDDGGQPVGFDDTSPTWWENLSDGYDASRVVFPQSNDPEKQYDVRDYAEQALGLTYGQASDLFNGSNSYETVIRVIGELLKETEPEPEPEPVRTVRRRKPAYSESDCDDDCDLCYEDAPVEESR